MDSDQKDELQQYSEIQRKKNMKPVSFLMQQLSREQESMSGNKQGIKNICQKITQHKMISHKN